MKLNNKGFTVVELLASFILTMIIVIFLFEIVLELKNVYVNESVKSETINKNAIVANSIEKLLESSTIGNVSCTGTSCAITFITDTGNHTKNINVNPTNIQIDKQKITFPSSIQISNINLQKKELTAPDLIGDNSLIKIEYTLDSPELSKKIKFNYVYTYRK